MKNSILYQEHCTPVFEQRQLLLPLDVSILVDLNDPVRWVNAFVDSLTDGEVRPTQSSLRGRKQTHPQRMLLKICLMGSVLARDSLRQIEDLCRHDVRFLWLLEGLPAPDHTTLWRFKERFRHQMPELMRCMVRWLYQKGLITSDHVFIDGTKMEAMSNRYTFVWKKSVLKYLERLLGKLPELVDACEEVLSSDEVQVCLEQPEETLLLLIELVQLRMNQLGVVLVSGKGSRKHETQRLLEVLTDSLKKVRSYQQQIATCGAHRNSYCKTDQEATFMLMKNDHMRNGQLKPAYNLNIAVNSEFIVGVDISQDRTDYHRACVILDELEQIFTHPVGAVVMDAGYDCEENHYYCREKGILPYIKPQYYEAQKKKSYRNNPKNWKSMIYDAPSDTFTCLGEKKLFYTATKQERTAQELPVEKRIYTCEDCSDCPKKAQCTKAKGNRQVHWNKRLHEWREESEYLIQTEQGIRYRLNRSIQAEGTFGTMKSNRGWNRLRHTGLEKNLAETIWQALGYDLLKLSRKALRDDPWQHLLIPKEKSA